MDVRVTVYTGTVGPRYLALSPRVTSVDCDLSPKRPDHMHLILTSHRPVFHSSIRPEMKVATPAVVW